MTWWVNCQIHTEMLSTTSTMAATGPAQCFVHQPRMSMLRALQPV